MELGRDKCGVLLCKGKEVEAAPRRRVNQVLDLESDDEPESNLEELYTAHKEAIYGTPEGTIPTVTSYKYLGITVDEDLGEQSMEYKFALNQSKKGLHQLHELRLFLTDQFCPIQLKVALVRNLVYPTMLYGAEFVGFQKLHAELLQQVINLAAKWIMGLAKHSTSMDAFTLCYELGLPPIFLEMAVARAQLGYKLSNGQEKLKTWIQQLYDNPTTYSTRHLTWVMQTKKWLRQVECEKHKYSRNIRNVSLRYHLEGCHIVEDEDEWDYHYFEDTAAPLHPWVQIGRCLEMSVRSNQYRYKFMERLMAEMTGEWENGGVVETPYLEADTGLIKHWCVDFDFNALGDGVIIPEGRTRGEVKKLLLVQHVVLERLMDSQRTVNWCIYDTFYFGITRGFLREAVNRTDLAEGVHWLVLSRIGAFPQVERAWQRITRSGKKPRFARKACPLCSEALKSGQEDLAHLVVTCKVRKVKACRDKYLHQCINHLDQVKA